MAEQTNGGNSAPENTTGQAGTEQAPRTFTQEQVDAIIADRLQRERAKYADYETFRAAAGRLKDMETAQLSEAEKQQKKTQEAEQRAQAAEQRYKETSLRMAIEREARKLSIVDEDAAFRLLDLSAVQYGADGAPSNVAELLRDLVAKKQYLVGAMGGGSATNPARGTSSPATFTRAQIEDRTFWIAHKDEIMRALAEGRIREE